MLNRGIDQTLYESYSDDIPTFLKKIYAARAISESQLSLNLGNLLRPSFGDLDKALDILENALIEQKRILIVGDFDADGATASVVAIRSLRMMGAKYADFLVPNRFEHGYGLSPEIVELAKKEKQPDIIITVDNGISSHQGTDLAKSLGIDVIITDHHLPSEKLPSADAIINPNLDGCDFKSKNLAGVGVSFYLFSALKTRLKKTHYFVNNDIPVPDLRKVLDLVALGTVADVVKLDQNNRILIAEGVKRIRSKKCCAGIIALLEIANRNIENLQASDLGFSVGPRLNAAGRLSDISMGIRCLLSDDMNDARRYAGELEKLNNKRREEQERIQKEAQAIVEKQELVEGKFSISLFDPSWHEGIVGIVAGKLKEKYCCPCAVFAQSGATLKGSIRSIPSVHIKDLLDIIDRQNEDLIIKFGGHAMAAGLSISKENFWSFKREFSKAIKRHLEGKKPKVEILTDGKLDDTEISLDNAKLILQSAPWGQGFEEPIFFGEFEIVEQRVVGIKHLKCRLKLIGSKKIIDGIAFFQEKLQKKKAVIAYKLSVNSYKGDESLQLIIDSLN
jgi:single-stranded-DNA-specific exonuclease